MPKATHKVAFDQKWVDALTTGEEEVIYTDTKTEHFQLRAYASGKVVYYFKRWFNGRPRSRCIGIRRVPKSEVGFTLKEAREKCLELNAYLTKHGVFEDEDQKSKLTTISDLQDLLVKHHYSTLRPSSIRAYDSIWNTHIKPAIGNRTIKSFTKEDASTLFQDVGTNVSKAVANNVLKHLSLLFNNAIRLELLSKNPCKGLSPHKRGERDRFLSEDEIVQLLEGLEGMNARKGFHAATDPGFVAFIKLCLTTGQRSHNIVRIRWSQVDLEKQTWTIPPEEMKTDNLNVVRLSAKSVSIITEFPRDREYVLFPDTKDPQRMLERWRMTWVRTRKLIGLDDVTIHDLRRTFGAIMANNNYSLHAIADALGQTSISATSIYAQLDEEAKKRAVDDVDKALPKGF